MALSPISKGVRVQIIAPPHNSRRAIQAHEVFDQTGIITREGSSSNGGWFEIKLDTDPNKLVYYRRGSLRLLDGEPVYPAADWDEVMSFPESPPADDVSSISDPPSEGSPSPRKKARKCRNPMRSIQYGDEVLMSPLDWHSLAVPFHVVSFQCVAANAPAVASPSASSISSASSLLDFAAPPALPSPSSKYLVCASCKIDRSPYWHKEHTNALHVTLCNACGIRFKKYKKHCASCCYVLRREEQDVVACPRCNNMFEASDLELPAE